MRSQRKGDIVAGGVIALLGAVVILAASQIRGDVEERLPPRTLPYVVGFLTLAGGLALAVKSYRYRGEDPRVDWPDSAGWVRIGVHLLLLALFAALMDPLGMPIATALYVAVAIGYMDRKRVAAALLTGAVSALVVYFLFIKLLGLTFPLGPLAR
ncbi:MAG: tripartite tricarboxylate transporter TctB family protein [Deltaproteobacteria bacterium]|nr:tripartite tricarboxylate transporter TctB family protein [Deltaproteobacteria bacterium]